MNGGAVSQITQMPNLPISSGIIESTKGKEPKGIIGPSQLVPALQEQRQAQAAAEAKVGQSEIDVEEAKRKEKATEAEMRKQFLERTAQEMKDLPERKALQEARSQLGAMKFAPTKDTAKDLGVMFSLISIVGAIAGRTSSRGALGAMSGMMEGYQKGRADLYKQQQIEFDKNFKAMQSTVQTLEKELEEAMKLKTYDKEAGEQAITMAIAKADSPMLKALRQKVGDVAVLNTVKQGAQDFQKTVDSYNSIVQKNIEAQQRERLARLQREATLAGQFKDVRGQMIGLVQNFRLPQQEVMNLGPKEIAAVSSNLEAAELTQSLANDIRANPQAAGIVSSFIGKIDKLLPSRYSNQDSSTGVNILKSEADKIDTGGTPDEISKARQIAKKAVDVINARAMAASGGSRVLVSELNLQKGVIGLEGLSPQSAVDVYSNLAAQDIEKNRRYGLSAQTLDNVKKQIGTQKAAAPAAAPQTSPVAVAAPSKEKAKPGEQIYTDASGNKAVKRGEQWVEVE